MIEKIRNLLRGQILSSVLFIGLGASLAILPAASVTIICKILFGVVMILAGAYHILIHLFEKANATVIDLFSGVILLVFGVFLFMNPVIVVKLLPNLLGAFVLADSVWFLKGAVLMKLHRRGTWKILLLGNLVFIALGIVLICNPFSVVKYTIIFAGIVFLVNGISDLLFLAMIHYGIKKSKEEENAPVTESTDPMEEKPEGVPGEAPVYAEWSRHAEAPVSESLPETSPQVEMAAIEQRAIVPEREEPAAEQKAILPQIEETPIEQKKIVLELDGAETETVWTEAEKEEQNERIPEDEERSGFEEENQQQ